jgi:hypothetical protein
VVAWHERKSCARIGLVLLRVLHAARYPHSTKAQQPSPTEYDPLLPTHAQQPQRAESAGATHEEAVLAEFKRMLSERGVALPPEMAVAGDEDATLRRFLRARKWRLDAAFQMLTSCVWRAFCCCCWGRARKRQQC